MYWIVNFVQFCGSIAAIVHGSIAKESNWIVVGCLNIFLFPLYQEPIYNLFSYLFGKPDLIHSTEQLQKYQNCNGILYSENYNISFFGVEKLHAFDSSKYRRAFNMLLEKGTITREKTYEVKQKVDRYTLLQNMSWTYLLILNYSIYISKIVEIPLIIFPNWLIRYKLLDRMLYSSQGSIESGSIAMQKGFSINLSGGYHHASHDWGMGFCIYPDIQMLVDHLYKVHNINRIVIIDLDAHQGNGYGHDYLKHVFKKQKDPNYSQLDVFLIDFYNKDIFPCDYKSAQSINIPKYITQSTSDKQFIEMITSSMNQAINQFNPQFVIYNAGTDCLCNDPLGQLNISRQGIIDRDEKIFEICLQNKIPITMLLSGGYQMINAQLIADSIQNLFTKFNLNSDYGTVK